MTFYNEEAVGTDKLYKVKIYKEIKESICGLF